jgi:hypothetical protein
MTVDEVRKQPSKHKEALNNMTNINGIGTLRFSSGQVFNLEDAIQKRITRQEKQYRRKLDSEEIAKIRRYTKYFPLQISIPVKLTDPTIADFLAAIGPGFEECAGASRHSPSDDWRAYTESASVTHVITPRNAQQAEYEDITAREIKSLLEGGIYRRIADAIHGEFPSSTMTVGMSGDWDDEVELKGLFLLFHVASTEPIRNPQQLLFKLAKAVNSR